MKINKMVLGVFLTLILSKSALSATLVIEDGQLVGADGITSIAMQAPSGLSMAAA